MLTGYYRLLNMYGDKGKDKRIIYLINGLDVEILCMLDRGREYMYLRNYLKNQGYLYELPL